MQSINALQTQPHRWCYVANVLRECGRSWVQAPIGSNQRLSNLYLLPLC